MFFASLFLMAATLLSAGGDGVSLKIEANSSVINPAKSVLLTVELRTAPNRTATMPDLGEHGRLVGFWRADCYPEPTRTEKDGTTVVTECWKLDPEAAADVYKIRPFAVKVSPKMFSSRDDEGKFSFVAGPVYFEKPAAREPVTGAMEVDPSEDIELSWKLAWWVALAVLVLVVAVYVVVAAVRYLTRRVREHMMSPVERAWVELDRLLQKGLPGRGRYKDFYVELTMVVRRYVQRQHGVVAPHLTTEEFFAATRDAPSFQKETLDELILFLNNADLVKFAGVQATPDMADSATASARAYIEKDDRIVKDSQKGSRS